MGFKQKGGERKGSEKCPLSDPSPPLSHDWVAAPRDVCPPNRVAVQPKGTEPHLSILN